MTPEQWWRRRAGCARTVMQGSFTHGMGRMDRVEPRMAAALQDILARPGSLVRAVIAYLVGIEMGLAEEASRALGCGVEYLHTASLVFDDLPAMDDARTRRGASCIHVVHGESVAMLAALAMINRAYAMIWQGINQANAKRRSEAGEVWMRDSASAASLVVRLTISAVGVVSKTWPRFPKSPPAKQVICSGWHWCFQPSWARNPP